MSLLHLTYDLRDRFGRETTIAVKNVIIESERITKTLTIDLVRVQKFRDELIKSVRSNHLIVNTFGLPYGILLLKHLRRTHKYIENADRQDLINLKTVTLIHAHKLTFEGYIGYILSKKMNIPLMVTLRQTDLQVMKYRPDLIPLYRSILIRSNKIFYLLPIMLKFFENQIGRNFFSNEMKSKLVYLPNIVERPIKEKKTTHQRKLLLTILRMTGKSIKRKNIKNLLRAFSQLEDKSIIINIIGEGDHIEQVKDWVTKFGIRERVEFLGSVPNDKIDTYYNDATAFILPSFSESFGMVYAESLLNGTPILYSRGVLGFDGMFENVGVGVNPYSVESIKNGINKIIKQNTDFRNSIILLKNLGRFHIFSANYVRENYYNAISGVKNNKH